MDLGSEQAFLFFNFINPPFFAGAVLSRGRGSPRVWGSGQPAQVLQDGGSQIICTYVILYCTLRFSLISEETTYILI